MKSVLLATSTVAALILLAACEPESKPPKPHSVPVGQIGATPTPSPTATPAASPTPDAAASPTPGAATPTPTPKSSPSGSIPYGIPVPGRPGFVVSPYSQNSGFVDVRGFAPNSEVKDPYSGKTFLVP